MKLTVVAVTDVAVTDVAVCIIDGVVAVDVAPAAQHLAWCY